MPTLAELLPASLQGLLRELVTGPPGDAAFVLNPGDRGLLASLDALSADQASERPGGRASVAAHVDHLRYGFELMNRWARGEDPWRDADFGPSWNRQRVDETQWRTLRTRLADEVRTWIQTCGERREWDQVALAGTIASVAHLAYHLGAIRQLQPATKGPPERPRQS